MPELSDSKFVNWPIPALARAKGTWLGESDLSHFLPAPTQIGPDCDVHHEFPETLQKPMEDLVDAFLYLGPQDLRLKEKIPADIALDATYQKELQKGAALVGFPQAASETQAEFDQQIVISAANPLFVIPIYNDVGVVKAYGGDDAYSQCAISL